jgi:hypothetical protein
MRTPGIVSSGWWVAAAAGLLSLVIVAVLILPIFTNRREGAVVAPAFDLRNPLVPRELIVSAMARDALQVLVEPATIGPEEIERFNREERGKLLVPHDRVIGVHINGQARAYPLRVMRWHEVVNDVVGGQPVAVTYSPLCDSVVVFSREVGDAVLELGVSGLLYNSNPLLYDRTQGPPTSPLWTQLDGRAVAGPDPASQAELSPLFTTLTTWENWREQHPETDILAQIPEMKKLYKRDPYHSYFGSDLLRFPVDPLPPGNHALKERLVVVAVDGVNVDLSFSKLAAQAGKNSGTTQVDVLGLPLKIDFDIDLGVAAVTPLEMPERLQSVRYAFWFAWYAMNHSQKGTIPGIISAAN